jgi:adenosine kinase
MNNKERPEILSIIGIGDCMVDIITEINSEIINLYHLENDQTKYTDENTKNIFKELESMPFVQYIPGGSTQNILRVLSYLLHENSNFNNNGNNIINIRVKYEISMLGSIGEDVYKEKIINSLNHSKIKPLLKISNGETSRCGAGFYNKKPFLISEVKASKNLDKEFILSNKDNILKHEILLIEGYYLQYQFELCWELCELFRKEENKLIILTLSPISLNPKLLEKFIYIANYADIIFSNKSQAEEFASSKGEIDNKKIFEKIFQKLSTNNKKKILVVKNGKEAAYCAKYNYQEKHLEFILTSIPQQIKNEEIVDEIGFEDAFFGGFLSEYMKGNSLYYCLKKGNEISNIVLKNPGCTFGRKK